MASFGRRVDGPGGRRRIKRKTVSIHGSAALAGNAGSGATSRSIRRTRSSVRSGTSRLTAAAVPVTLGNRGDGHRCGAIARAASADVMTGLHSKSATSRHCDIHTSSN